MSTALGLVAGRRVVCFMPTRITVTAVVPLVYRGHSVAAGESFEVKPVEALALHYKQQVTLVPLGRTIQTRQLRAEPDDPAPRVKRQYRRRDMGPEA